MPQFDTKELPRVGDQLRIRLAREDTWVYLAVEKVSPTFSFIQLKVLGIKEVPFDEPNTEPAQLADTADPMGSTIEHMDRPHSPRPSTPRRTDRDRDLPPSPALEVEQKVKNNDGQLEIF